MNAEQSTPERKRRIPTGGSGTAHPMTAKLRRRRITPREIAEAIAAVLFVNAFDGEADRLVLVDKAHRDMGGWCKKAVADQVERIIKEQTE